VLPADPNLRFPLLGSYLNREYAEREAADLLRKAGAHLKGRTVVINEKWFADGLHHRVMIEPPTTADEARKLCMGLADLGFKACTPVKE
jgi:hypothetical protein